MAASRRIVSVPRCAGTFGMRTWPHPVHGREESLLWEMALAVSPRAVTAWETKNWLSFDFAVEQGILGVHHRLADLARREGRIDAAALSLYAEVFSGRCALPWQKHYPGGENNPAQLIERGARITPAIRRDPREARRRYGLCLCLALQGFSAGWLNESLSNPMSFEN